MAKRTGIKNWMREAYIAGDMARLEKQPSFILRRLEALHGGSKKVSAAKANKKKGE